MTRVTRARGTYWIILDNTHSALTTSGADCKRKFPEHGSKPMTENGKKVTNYHPPPKDRYKKTGTRNRYKKTGTRWCPIVSQVGL